MSEPAPAGWAEIGWVAAHRQTNWEKGGERGDEGFRRGRGRGGVCRKGAIEDDDRGV